jgi:hypothetical protein
MERKGIMGKKPVRVGLKKGGRNPRDLIILTRANDDAAGILDTTQYLYVASKVREVARSEDPTHCPTVSVQPIEDFHEIRLKGGVLAKLNTRVFFFYDKDRETMVVLGVIKKENEGATALGDKITMRRRKRTYLIQYRPAALPKRDEHKS